MLLLSMQGESGLVWVHLDEEDTSNAKELMTALNDILKLNQSGTGYFSTIFANALISNEAFITKLATSVIKLQKDANNNYGQIYSDNFYSDEEHKVKSGDGFYIGYDGTAEFNNMTAKGGKFNTVDITNTLYKFNRTFILRWGSSIGWENSYTPYDFFMDLLQTSNIPIHGESGEKTVFRFLTCLTTGVMYNNSTIREASSTLATLEIEYRGYDEICRVTLEAYLTNFEYKATIAPVDFILWPTTNRDYFMMTIFGRTVYANTIGESITNFYMEMFL